MDRLRIGEIARAHKALSQEPVLGERDTSTREARAFDVLWASIQDESNEYCMAYNEAFGSTRIKVESHPDSIVIRSELDPQDTLVFHRTPSTDTHRGTFDLHRYHYGQPPVSLPAKSQSSEAGEV